MAATTSMKREFLFLGFFLGAISPAAATFTEEFAPFHWYTKYPSYPEYCSTPGQMNQRKIPPLRDDDSLIGETRLVHVTAIIRHGARTPWSGEQTCWNGFWNETKDTSRWDCDLTTVMAPPDPNTVLYQEGITKKDWLPDDAFFLFEKIFDALNTGEPGALTNELNGTCEKGQMLLQGYEQEILNGRFMRDAYGHESMDYNHDERMRLFDLGFQSSNDKNKGGRPPWDADYLYLRADDDQRTVMSGQVLLRGLFEEEVVAAFQRDGTYPNIVLHTADRNQDVLDANVNVCPRLAELQSAALQSQEYQRFNNSDQMQSLRWFTRDKLGTEDPFHLLDCLMTTICTDRELPEAIDDFNLTDETSMFQAVALADIQSFNLVMKYNNAAFAKLALGPLWAEIMENINPWLTQNNAPDDFPAPKLAIFSGHDTTIMPLLASIHPNLWNDTEWAAYASMMLIEIHELIDGRSNKAVYTTDFAFRLLFNGRILTPLVPGCHAESELCDITHLKAIIDPIATRDPDCRLSTPPTSSSSLSSSQEVIVQAETLLNTTVGIMLFLGLVLFGMLLGALGTYILLTGRLPCIRTPILEASAVETDHEARQGLQDSHQNYDDGDENEDGFVDTARGEEEDTGSSGLQ